MTPVAPPILTTARLTLRPYRMADFDAYAGFFASARARHMGTLTRNEAWYAFAAETGAWALQGHGAWAVEITATGRLAGQVGLLQPAAFPELELGWFLYDGFERHGYARESALAARAFAARNLGRATLVSYIGPGNTRSRALAERLGGTIDPEAARPARDDALVYRHDMTADLATNPATDLPRHTEQDSAA